MLLFWDQRKENSQLVIYGLLKSDHACYAGKPYLDVLGS